MLNAEILIEAEQRRLAWRCRRGMLELDIVLQRFIAKQFKQLNLQELKVFDSLLALPDTDFWALMTNNNGENLSAEVQLMITKLKNTSHV